MKLKKTKAHHSKEKDWLGWNLKILAKENGLELIQEYRFHPVRKWRFDWAITDLKIAIEYEGISGKSRHTTITGYTGDAEKYREAAIDGWVVLRYTVLDYKKVCADLQRIINKRVM